MKKLKLVTIIVAAAALLTGASSTIVPKAVLSDAKLHINGLKFSVQDPVLNVFNRIYVPLRAVAENLGNDVTYSEHDKAVYIRTPSNPISTLNSVVDDNESGFRLGLYSAKSQYTEGEDIRIWTRLTNISGDDITISHGGGLLYYSITDFDGFTEVMSPTLQLAFTNFGNHDEFTSELSEAFLTVFSLKKAGVTELHEAPEIVNLPVGTYTIKAISEFGDEWDRKKTITAEIEIEILEE
jgi:hypothetical protein